jgi:hypothetical protein
MSEMTLDQATTILHFHCTSSHNEEWIKKRDAWAVIRNHISQPRNVAQEDANSWAASFQLKERCAALEKEVERLKDEVLQNRHIIRFNDEELARLSTCQIDADRYRWLRSCHEAQIGKRCATVVMWADEPWEPEAGYILDEAIDFARSKTVDGGGV